MAAHAMECPKLPWMIDFHSTADGAIPNTQLKSTYAENYMEYLTSLNIDSALPKQHLSSIICSIGPSSSSVETMEKMIKAGMKVARINMSFYNTTDCLEIVKNLRKAALRYSKKSGRLFPLAIALDIKGAEIRTGSLKDERKSEIELQEGATVSLTSDPAYSEHVTEDMIYVDYQKLPDVVEPGDTLYFDDGKVRLSALEIVGSIIKCLIENAGKLAARSLLSAPGIPIDLPFLSEKDIEDLNFCVQENIDVIFAPISNTSNIKRVKDILGEPGQDILIFAKITNAEGVRNIDEIIASCNGIVLLRSRITMEIAKEKLYIIQKSIIAKCNQAGVPIICAPQMLESMVVNQRPTNAELSDVSNAILDGVDGILLSQETSVGKYPIETIETLVALCKEAEPGVYQKQLYENLLGKFVSPVEIIHSLAMSSVDVSLKTNAAVIVVTTTTGRTAQLIAKYRPRCPIIAITRISAVARRLQMFRGVDALQYLKPSKQDWNKELMRRVQLGVTYGKVTGLIRAGDAIVMVISPKPSCGFTNSIKVVYASEFDTLPVDAQ